MSVARVVCWAGPDEDVAAWEVMETVLRSVLRLPDRILEPYLWKARPDWGPGYDFTILIPASCGNANFSLPRQGFLSLSTPKPQHGRLLHLDVLRGLAALAVVYGHLAEYVFFPHWSPDWKGVVTPQMGWAHHPAERWVAEAFRGWVDCGKVGVILFFALSGFVIHYSLSERRRKPIATFVVRRFCRIYPAYWASLLLALVLVLVDWMPRNPDGQWAQFLVNATMLQEFVGVTNVMGVYWTLAIELAFYVSCGILFLIGFMQRPGFRLAASIGFLLMALAGSIVAWQMDRRLPLAPGLALSIMFWATLWQGWILDSDRRCLVLSRIGLVSILLLIPVITLLGYNSPEETFTGGIGWRYMGSYLVAFILFVIYTRGFRNRVWGPAPLVWLGTISYSLYLMHTLVMYAGEASGVMQWMKQYPPTVYFLLVIVVSIGVSFLTWYLIERTFQRLARRWTPWESR